MFFRNQHKAFQRLVGLSILLVLISLACSLPGRQSDSKPDKVTISTEAAGEMEKSLNQAAKDMEKTGKVDIQFTEEQVTSYLALQLAQQPEQIFKDPQIFLRDGTIEVNAKVTQGDLSLPLKASLQVQADGQGGLSYEIKEAKLGPLSLPDQILNSLTSQIDTLIGGSLTEQIPDVYIEEITIGNGLMTVRGYRK